MERKRERDFDPDLVSRVAALPEAGQRWLKTALVTIWDFDSGAGAEEAPPRRREEPPPEEGRPIRRVVDLEEVLSGRARLEDQLEAYPELADELEGLADVIDLLREAGQARRRKGEDVLRELGLEQSAPDEDQENREPSEE